ncbi:MAG: hypothetical protein RJB09_2621, partial [Pseudomonadota bacterium]
LVLCRFTHSLIKNILQVTHAIPLPLAGRG